MKSSIVLSFVEELTKIAETAFTPKQYKELYGPKRILKNKRFANPKENVPASQYNSLSNNDSTYHPIGSADRVAEGRETPGGPL